MDQHSPSILIRQTWEAPNITISHGSTYRVKDEGRAGGPNLARRFFFFRYRRFTHGGQMDRISVRWVELVVGLETMICVICWETTCFKKTHAYLHRIAHPPARRTKEKEPPQAKEIPKGRSMQTVFWCHGVMAWCHGVMVS